MAELQLAGVRDEIMVAIAEFKTRTAAQIEQIQKNGVVDPETKEALTRVAKRIDELEARFAKPGASEPTLAKSLGALIIESERAKAFQASGRKGNFSVEVPTLWESKTTITSAAIGSATSGILTPLRVPGIVEVPLRPLSIRDLLRSTPTTNNAVEFVKENVFTNAASPQVETVAKGESALTFTIAAEKVQTIAHWIPAAKQILDDFSQLANFIDYRLRGGLKIVEENQLLTGSGSNQDLHGLITQATAYDTNLTVAADTKLDTLRHALLQVSKSYFFADGIVLNPTDAAAIELIKDEAGGANKGRYIVGDPNSGGAAKSLWGRPVAESFGVPAGKFLVGAFALGAEIFDRMQATVDISTEHSTYFTSNLVAVRCEERLALCVYRPLAFVYGTFV
ncbi:MAG TPA: phage major capsid protein [Sphingomicrobium sp.]|jgi:HK97 family phage major capsid protein|nr:phage major capsid protein [Sphingomicrobium sp.]